ncbi:hypothetical protein [Robertkochia solimangrovi]|uniref:hypothetical protein n=1 Tax=Robertkochia solimangrovi TaxID=2213046 RepID=UPI0011805A6A|nr:hypothetical protein [Robertkochia solimangrovi]TRZ46244.1 hypothetical protein DMZ48_03020 [Robertkochia solimangrovi]
MKIKMIIAAFMFLIAGQAFAQGKGNSPKARQQKEQSKKAAAHHRALAKEEREFHRELRKEHLKHLKKCHSCNVAFYHNTKDYYYKDDVYYAKKDDEPIHIDAEVFFKFGSIKVSL